MNAEATARKYVDLFLKGDIAGFTALYAPTTSYRQVMTPAPLTTPQQVMEFESGMFALFSDLAGEITWLVADGDRVALGIRIQATHSGDMPTPDGGVIPAKGARITHEAADYVRVDAEGRIVDHQRYQDIGSMVAQLKGGAG